MINFICLSVAFLAVVYAVWLAVIRIKEANREYSEAMEKYYPEVEEKNLKQEE